MLCLMGPLVLHLLPNYSTDLYSSTVVVCLFVLFFLFCAITSHHLDWCVGDAVFFLVSLGEFSIV